jgi:hypothetical protein
VQAHKPLVRAFECLWWAHIAAHSRRDQLSMVKVVADLALLPRTTVLEYKFFTKVAHAHEKGRALDLASGVSPYMPFEPLPAQGRRLFLDLNTNQHPGRSALQAFLKRATVYGMQDGWGEVPLRDRTEFELRSWPAVHDLVVLHLDVAPTDDRPAQLLKRFVADGVVMLVDLVLVEYATADPSQLRQPTMVDFRTTLRDVVENWGVPAMTHWNSSAGTGWEERACGSRAVATSPWADFGGWTRRTSPWRVSRPLYRPSGSSPPLASPSQSSSSWSGPDGCPGCRLSLNGLVVPKVPSDQT